MSERKIIYKRIPIILDHKFAGAPKITLQMAAEHPELPWEMFFCDEHHTWCTFFPHSWPYDGYPTCPLCEQEIEERARRHPPVSLVDEQVMHSFRVEALKLNPSPTSRPPSPHSA